MEFDWDDKALGLVDNDLHRSLRLHGLNVRPDALSLLRDVLRPL